MKLLSLPLAVLLGLVMIVPASGATSVFTGEWIGNDPAPPDGDGSTVHLYVTGGSQAKLTFTDDFGTVCERDGSPVTEFTSTLVGETSGDTLTARFVSARCGPVPLGFLRGGMAVYELDDQNTADPADDTLWDGLVLFRRV